MLFRSEEALQRADEELKQFSRANYRTLEACSRQVRSDVDLLKVKLSSEQVAEGTVVLLEGWVPVENESELEKYLDGNGIYYEARNATREDDVPVKFKNNAFTANLILSSTSIRSILAPNCCNFW